MKLNNRGYYDVFVSTCAKYPSRIAVKHYDDGVYKDYTYSEMYGACEYITQIMQQFACNKGVVGIQSHRNILIPCLIAASHKYCTTFMFLDPLYNIENLTNDIKFKVIISIQTKDSARTSDSFWRQPDKSISIFDLLLHFFDFQPSYSQMFGQPLEYSYIAVTSGSTGNPKLVQVPLQCLQPNIDDLTKMFEITPQDVIYFSSPLTFDPSMIEILLAIVNGASLLIAPENPNILFPKNKANSVTFWQTTPSKFFQYSNADIKNKILTANSTLRILALGGEPLNGIKRLKELKHTDNRTALYTLYGVTEMSCWACVTHLDLNKVHDDKEMPLGNCLSETDVVIQPFDKKSCNKESGKIILVSKTRTCVILNHVKGNAEKCSFTSVDTGDIGEKINGTIYYRGRKDSIIKKFGNKVNLQHIEDTIMLCPRVKTCSCIWLPKPMLIVTYFSSETLKSQELSDFLKCKLDDKHWPDKIIRVDSLPTSSHGKISRAMISKMYEATNNMPQTLDSLSAYLLKELKSVLGTNYTYEEIKNNTFFEIGGTSFLAVSMCNKISLSAPQLGQTILPYLMTEKVTIDELVHVTLKELKAMVYIKKRMKRAKSSEIDSCFSKKLSPTSSKAPAQFIVAWTHDTGKCVDASPTLFIYLDTLYVTAGSHSGKLVTVDGVTGDVKGTIRLKSRVEASVFCYQHNPALEPCGVVGAYDGTVICFNLKNCNEIWKINIGSMVKSKAVCCDGVLYLGSYDGNIRCIDILTGKITHIIDVSDLAISADLVLAKNEYIILSTLSGICTSIYTRTNTVVWRVSLSSPVFASPMLYDADKYAVFAEVNGVIHCRTVEKGIKIWSYLGAGGNIFSSIFVKQLNKVKWQMVFGCHDNCVYSIIINNSQASLHWKTDLASPVYCTPCALNEKCILAASTNGTLRVLESETGNYIAEYTLPNEIFSSPKVFGDNIFIGCRNDHLYCIKYILLDQYN